MFNNGPTAFAHSQFELAPVAGTVNGLPGGFPARDPESRHRPKPERHRELFLVGDYLFDSTIYGVRNSADFVADRIVDSMASGDAETGSNGIVDAPDVPLGSSRRLAPPAERFASTVARVDVSR